MTTNAPNDALWMPEPPVPPVSLPQAADLVKAPPRLGPDGRLLRRLTSVDGITYKIADCRSEREDAFRLIYEAYTSGGLMEPNRYQMRVTPFDLLPTTDLFVALHGDLVICTMTLICDDFEKLPIRSLFDREVQAGHDDCYLAEISCMAARQRHFPPRQMTTVLLGLVAMMFQYCRRNDIQRLLIAAHPGHFRLFRRSLGFVQMGQQKEHLSRKKIPVIASQHDFARLDTHRYPLHDYIYGRVFQRWELLRQPMLQDDREFFGPVAELCRGYAPVFAD